MSSLFAKLVVIVFGITTLCSFQISDAIRTGSQSESPLSASDQQLATGLATKIQASEWLGPLAPIAISPFFGITCLAAMSRYGGSIVAHNAFVSSNPVLNNPNVLWAFLFLTLLTSLPRLTKVTKPAAQAIDQIEAYAGIITILVIRFLPILTERAIDEPATAMVVQMGVFSFSADMLFGVAAIINIVVINTVKFFFEVMVWLIPFPFVDAMLEVTNKSLCAGLMAVYVWSPLAATAINLVLFAVCLIMFQWVNRRVAFLRSIIGDPVWGMVSRTFGKPTKDELVVFAKSGFYCFPTSSKLILRPTDAGWQVLRPRFLMPAQNLEIDRKHSRLILCSGFWINRIEIKGSEPACLLFSRRHSEHLDQLAMLLRVERSNIEMPGDLKIDIAEIS